MVNERERDAVSDVIIIIDSRAVSETGPVSRNALVYSTRARHHLPSTSSVVEIQLVSSFTVMKL